MKNFLEEVSEDAMKREKYVSSPVDFTRSRVLNFECLVFLLLNCLKRSLMAELMSFFSYCSIHGGCSKQAFSKARRKLKACFFHDWNRHLIGSFYTHYKDKLSLWKGFKVLAVDGSSIAVADTEENREIYGHSSNQSKEGTALARICVLYDVLNQLVRKGILHPYPVSEEEAVWPLLEGECVRDCVLVFDRGYLSYRLIHQLEQANTHFLMRASTNANNIVKGFLSSDQRDLTIDFYPPSVSRRKLGLMAICIPKDKPLKIRLVKILLSTGETEVLVTNLYDKQAYPVEELSELYWLRWGVETWYGHIKEKFQLGVFSGTRAICIEQDFAATLVLSNLQSIIEKQCGDFLKHINKKRKYEYKVNKNISLSCLKYRVVKLFREQNPQDILLELEDLFCKELVPIRKERKYPRKKKRWYPKTKYYTLTNYKRAI